MFTSVAVRLLLLGSLVTLGTIETIVVAPLLRQHVVPTCCRQRVDTFASRARMTLLAAVVAVVAGLILLLA